jgi:hypothetical protein
VFQFATPPATMPNAQHQIHVPVTMVIQKIQGITIIVYRFVIQLALMASVMLLTNVSVIMDSTETQTMKVTVSPPVTHHVIMESVQDRIHVHVM